MVTLVGRQDKWVGRGMDGRGGGGDGEEGREGERGEDQCLITTVGDAASSAATYNKNAYI